MNKVKKILVEFLDGSLLTKDLLFKHLPYIVFLTVLAMIYISNRHTVEGYARKTLKLQQELKELRAESISISAELMNKSNLTEIQKLIDKNGLKLTVSSDAPKKLVVRDGSRQ